MARTLREKRRKLWWWAFKDRVGKLFSCVYIAFCTFYVACFCAIVSDETYLAYENTSSTALFAVIVIKPACYVLPLYSVLILQRCHNFWLLERLLDRFPDLTDFSFESKFLEARKKLDEGHHWLEAAPLAAGAGMFWAAAYARRSVRPLKRSRNSASTRCRAGAEFAFRRAAAARAHLCQSPARSTWTTRRSVGRKE